MLSPLNERLTDDRLDHVAINYYRFVKHLKGSNVHALDIFHLSWEIFFHIRRNSYLTECLWRVSGLYSAAQSIKRLRLLLFLIIHVTIVRVNANSCHCLFVCLCFLFV